MMGMPACNGGARRKLPHAHACEAAQDKDDAVSGRIEDAAKRRGAKFFIEEHEPDEDPEEGLTSTDAAPPDTRTDTGPDAAPRRPKARDERTRENRGAGWSFDVDYVVRDGETYERRTPRPETGADGQPRGRQPFRPDRPATRDETVRPPRDETVRPASRGTPEQR